MRVKSSNPLFSSSTVQPQQFPKLVVLISWSVDQSQLFRFLELWCPCPDVVAVQVLFTLLQGLRQRVKALRQALQVLNRWKEWVEVVNGVTECTSYSYISQEKECQLQRKHTRWFSSINCTFTFWQPSIDASNFKRIEALLRDFGICKTIHGQSFPVTWARQVCHQGTRKYKKISTSRGIKGSDNFRTTVLRKENEIGEKQGALRVLKGLETRHLALAFSHNINNIKDTDI